MKMGQGKSRPNGGKENISNKGEIISKSKDKDRLIEFNPPLFQIKENYKNNWKKIVAHIKKGHEISKPRDNPSFRPEGRMSAKNHPIHLNQYGVDIGPKILDQISKGLIDEDDIEDGREGVEKFSPLAFESSFGG